MKFEEEHFYLADTLFLFREHFSGKKEKIVYLTDNDEKANFISDFLSIFFEDVSIFLSDNSYLTSPSKIKHSKVFIITHQALKNGIADPSLIEKNSLRIRKNLVIKREDLIKTLIDENYLRVPVVEEKGEFAVRGFIVDFFLREEKQPIRVEFEGNRIEGIKRFDPITQRSVDSIFSYSIKRTKKTKKRINPLKAIGGDYRILIDGGMEQKNELEEEFGIKEYQVTSVLMEDYKEIVDGLNRVETLKKDLINTRKESFSKLSEEIRKYAYQENCNVLFTCVNSYHLERFYEIFLDYKLDIKIIKKDLHSFMKEIFQNSQENRIYLSQSPSLYSFYLKSLKFLHLSSSHLLGIKRQGKIRPVGAMPSLRDISTGDYVVHQTHGIGKFEALIEEEVGGVKKEFLKIRYKNKAKLFLPVENMHLIHKYISPSGKEPQLDNLGGSTWRKKSRKVEKSVEKVAREILELYAKRELTRPLVFEVPVDFYYDFLKTFQFEETESQKKAIEDVINDLTSQKSTDRLICGDAGFGKTEVAMRASLIAAGSGYQVLLLAPTTLLVEQHYRVFTERFKELPVIIEKLSRFVTGVKKRDVLKNVEEGKVDILISTHSALTGKLMFKNLGLLIIDEEHRFGVTQKEFFKKARENVEVISLSATPIPRTLYMALSGIKSMSIIDTPPPERGEVKTYITEFSEDVLKEAIKREIQRGGQVFFVHNRINNIEFYLKTLKKMFPYLIVEYAHGRLRPSKIESIMMKFINGEIDILVSTNIIEAGLDLPNVNTIIVNNAHTFGMADLYQLRGRVGRSTRIGYAYFLVPPGYTITDNATQRLISIRRHTNPGSAYKLALEDLEIRGAGTLLGKRQAGKIDEVGFDYYMELLKKSILSLKGFREKRVSSVNIKIPVKASIPNWYLPEDSLRLKMYRRLSGAENLKEVEEIREELIDRYGPLPGDTENLLLLVKVKIKAQKQGIEIIEYSEKGKVKLYFHSHKPIQQILEKMKKYSFVETPVKKDTRVVVKFKNQTIEEIIRDINIMLE